MIGRIVMPLALTAGLFLAAPGAEARDGCGPGFHRGFYGWCRPNFGYRPFVYAPRYRTFGYRGWGGPRRYYGWHHWHRWGGYHHAGWHHRWS